MIEVVGTIAFFVALFAGLTVIRGFTPHAVVRRNCTTYRLSAGISLVISAYVLREFYWGLMPALVSIFSPSLWDRWFEVSGLSVNLFFTAIMVRGLYHFLVLLWLLIPPRDRGHWSILTAPFYPSGRIFVRAADLRRWAANNEEGR